MWDDFRVEGRRHDQQEMTLGDLFQHIKVQLSYPTQTGKPSLFTPGDNECIFYLLHTMAIV